MGANSSSTADIATNDYLKRLTGTESISENDPFWNQLLSFTFTTPTNGQLFIWQAHNALFIIRCLLKTFVSQMPEEELLFNFTYQERAPLTYGSEPEDLLEGLICSLVHLIIEMPLLDITYSILLESVTTLLVLLSYQLFQKEIIRESVIYNYLMQGQCLQNTSRTVKTLLYNFIRQEKCPPQGTQIFEQTSVGNGLLYGLASGVASGLWTVLTMGGVGSKPAPQEETSSPLANRSLLLLLVLSNLSSMPNRPNPYRQSIMSFKNTQDNTAIPSPTPHSFQINFNSLYTALYEQQKSDQATLLLYTLLHQNPNVRTYVLARTDVENLVLPILEILYHVEKRNSHHVYMALIILLILTEEDSFNRSVHEVILKNITWYAERVLTEISLGSLLILVVIRTVQYNMTRTRDKYLHTNCLAALANMSAQFRSLHQYAAQRIISLFALLSKKHNKVLEQATQLLSGSVNAEENSPIPDHAQDLTVIEEVIRMMLEIINSCISSSLHHNPNLVYALLYKRDLFEQFRTHPSFQDVMQNLDMVISFFSLRLEQAGADLSVERVLEVIKQGAVALPKDKLKKFPELKFKYVEEDQPEEFFVPYVWSLAYNSTVELYWNPQQVQLFTMDSG
ncbi:dymeclin isoform X2 [Amblyraja radiata]|uniref:dymeclin isoform X2 n=1 Tax=Amblyraja radiata TaxID=386614 RepID=UPI0014028768|nr:dymeclin isoform X2 [Amblyraja radiata]